MVIRRYLKSEDEKKLFELLKKEGEERAYYWPDHTIYVMPEVDQYYEKQRYRRGGSIYEVTKDS